MDDLKQFVCPHGPGESTMPNCCDIYCHYHPSHHFMLSALFRRPRSSETQSGVASLVNAKMKITEEKKWLNGIAVRPPLMDSTSSTEAPNIA